MTKINGMKALLANAREICPGMGEDFYRAVQVVNDNVDENVTPDGLMIDVESTLNWLMKECEEMAYFQENTLYRLKAERMWHELLRFPQLVDAISDLHEVELEETQESFAEEFRKIWKCEIGFEPPYRVKCRDDESEDLLDYSPSIQEAVNYFTDELSGYRHKEMPIALKAHQRYLSKAVLREYRQALAEAIYDDISRRGFCLLLNTVVPQGTLHEVSWQFGVSNMISYSPYIEVYVDFDRCIINEHALSEVAWVQEKEELKEQKKSEDTENADDWCSKKRDKIGNDKRQNDDESDWCSKKSNPIKEEYHKLTQYYQREHRCDDEEWEKRSHYSDDDDDENV